MSFDVLNCSHLLANVNIRYSSQSGDMQIMPVRILLETQIFFFVPCSWQHFIFIKKGPKYSIPDSKISIQVDREGIENECKLGNLART